MPGKQHLTQIIATITVLLSLAATAIVYWPGLNGNLMLDDFENLRPLEQLDNSYTSLGDVVFSNESGLLGRPISMLTFAANYVLNGNDTWSYKYTNLAIHLLCGLLIYWLAARLLAHTKFAAQRWTLALFTMALWLTAPMWVSTTLYVIQRMAQLSTLFSLAGLICYVSGRERLDTHRTQGLMLLAACFLIFFPLALFSKENGALLPLLALCLEIFFFRFAGDPISRRVIQGIFVILVALPAIAGAFFLLLNPSHLSNGYALRDFTFHERVLTEPRILFSYIRGLLFPQGASLGLYQDDYLLSTSLLRPFSTLLAIIGWLALLSLSLVVKKEYLRWLSFGAAFFLAGHALESTILPLELYFEHRNYLPSFGIFFTLTLIAGQLSLYIKKPFTMAVLLALFPASYAFATYQRVQTWSSWEMIILSDAIHHPNSFRLNTQLAAYYATHGNLTLALTHLNKAEAIKPESWSGIALQRIALYCMTGTSIPSAAYQAMLESRPLHNAPYTPVALQFIRTFFEQKTCPQLDSDALIKNLKTWLNDPIYNPNPRHKWKLLLELAQLQHLSNRSAEAIPSLKQALALNPNELQVGLLAVRYQLASGDLQGAGEMLEILKAHDRGTRNDYTKGIKAYGDLLDKLKRHTQ